MNKRALEEAKETLKRTLEENSRLTEERDTSEKETYAITEMLRYELQEKTAEIERLKRHIDKIQEESKIEILKVKDEATMELRSLRKDAAEIERRYAERIASLEKQLDQVQSFRNRQAEIEQVVFNFQSEKKAIEESAATEKNALEENFFEETRRLKEDFEHRLDQQRIATRNAYDSHLDDRIKQILSQNRCMAVELNLHREETETLHREVRHLECERLRLLEELQFRIDLENGFAKRGAEQQTTIKAERSRALALEQSMQQVVIGASKQREALERRHRRQMEDAALEIEALKKLAVIKNKENGALRRAAQEVLLQRNEVERFLLSSIHKVREEIAREEANPVEGVSGKSIEDMIWPDRERVLKMLLLKIDAKGKQSSTPTLDELIGETSIKGPAEPT